MSKPLPWFRFYTEAIDDPKVQRLPPTLFKTWVNLLCLAGKNGGNLPSLDDIAFHLRLSIHDAEQQLSELILAGLIDIDGTGSKRSPHNWAKRQFVSDTSTERVRKHRQNKAKSERNGHETLHETAPDSRSRIQIQKTDTEKPKTSHLETRRDPVKRSPVGPRKASDFVDARFGCKSAEIDPQLLKRAEGFGLSVQAIRDKVAEAQPSNPSAFAQAVSKRMLRAKLPGISDATVGRALSGDRGAYITVQNLLLMPGGA